MASEPRRLGGALWGFGVGACVGVLPWLGLELVFNDRFVDAPVSLWLLSVVPVGLLGALVGALWRRSIDRTALALPLFSFTVVFGLSIDGTLPVQGLDLLVVGIDGATWEQVDPMVEAGELPHLNALRSRGAWGTMRAREPLFSPVLWTTMATGRRPDAHGVRGLRVHSADCQVPRFFDVAQAAGRGVGLYKWLVTWPPKPIDGGFVVPGWLAPTPETEPEALGFIKELELSRRLVRQRHQAKRSSLALAWQGARGGWRWSTLRDAGLWWLWAGLTRPSELDRFAYLQLLRARMDADVFAHRVRQDRPSVATFTTYATDAIGHRYWRYHEPGAFGEPEGHTHAEAVRDAYRLADRALGELQALLPEGGRLVVVSDHGFRASPSSDGTPVAPSTSAVQQVLSAQGLLADVVRVGTKITVTPHEVGRAAEVRAWANGALLDGAPIFRVEEVPDDPNAVALALLPRRLDLAERAHELVAGVALGELLRALPDQSGDHTPRGLFAAVGAGAQPGRRVDVDILDVAPIMLSALSLPADHQMPGRVPEGLWDEVGRTDHSAVLRAFPWPSARQGDLHRQQLEELGYVDGAR